MLDQKIKDWREQIKAALLDEDVSEARCAVRIAIGDRSVKVQGHPALKDAFAGLTNDIATTFRSRMPAQAWPISLFFECSRDKDILLSKFSISGMDLNLYSNRKLISSETVSWSRRMQTLTGIDRVAEDFDLISRMCPPSNQPVRAWSMGHTIMGTPHVSYDGFHARSEAEALLKIEWERYGREGLEEILENGGLREKRNDDKIFFVALDLFDFDLDPEGRSLGKIDVSDDIAKHLENLKDPSPDIEP